MHDGIIRRQIFQDVGRRRVARFRFLSRREPQFFKENRRQLLGRIDVEGFPRFRVNLFQNEPLAPLHVRQRLLPRRLVRPDARLLHRGQHRDERRLYRLQERRHALFCQDFPRFGKREVEETGFLRQSFFAQAFRARRHIENLRHDRARIRRVYGIGQIRRERQIVK